MKLYFASFCFLMIILSLSSCREDVIITNNFKETPILVGLLDKADSIHYIKVQRAFIGPGNSLDFAQIPDSNYFQNVTVKVEEIKNNSIVRSWDLYDTIVYNKNTSGLFFAPEQKLYAFKAGGSFGPSLDSTALYRVTANIENGKIVVTGQTNLVSDLKTTGANTVLKFVDNPGEYLNAALSFNAGTSVRVNSKVQVFYREFTSPNDSVDKSYIQNVGEITTNPNSSYSLNLNGQLFYEFLRDNIAPNPAVTKRQLLGFKYILVGGSEELVKYINANAPSSSLAQSKPNYTNLSVSEGYEVVGIFSSRKTSEFFKSVYQPLAPALRLIDQKSTRELAQGQYTGNLMFCSQHPSDNTTNFNCN